MATSDAAKNLPPDQAAMADHAKELDAELMELRARFDQFFLGMERKNPEKDLADYRKRLFKLKTDFIRNTALKFRVQTLWQKFTTYERLWLKTLREIEEGTYARDLFKLKRKQASDDRMAARKKERDDNAEKKERKDSWDLDENLEADLPDELFGPSTPALPTAPVPSRAPLSRQKTDPALPSEAGGPQESAPPPRANPTAPVARQPSVPPPPPPNTTPLPLPRQPSIPPAPLPHATAPLPRQPSAPPPPPANSVAPRPTTMPKPLPRQQTLPPPPPVGSVSITPPSQPVTRQKSLPPPSPVNAVGPAPVRATAPVATAGEGLSNDKVKKIYDAYITAKKRCKESTDGLTYEAVEQSLRKQVPQLMKDHGAKSVDFKVVIKDGKAVLKAVPK